MRTPGVNLSAPFRLPAASQPGWIKICGITRVEDALLAAECGAHAIGFIFAPSPRRLSPEAARAIIEKLPAEVLPVGVFVNASAEEMLEVARRSGVRALQLHGHEDAGIAADCQNFLCIKSLLIPPEVRIAFRRPPVPDLPSDTDKTPDFEHYPELKRDYLGWRDRADAFLYEQKRDSRAGAAGETFPATRRWIYAGRLFAESAAGIIRTLHPWGVDVSSGIESSPGVKDPGKLRAFIANARAAFQAMTNTPAEFTAATRKVSS